jgi:signal peptidase I
VSESDIGETKIRLKGYKQDVDMETMTEAPVESPSLLWRIIIGRDPKRTMQRVVILVVVVFVMAKFVLLPIQISGPSMLPTYSEHGVNFVNRLAYLFHEPRRGDVVAIRLAGPSIMFMKRIIGLPGETVAFHEGHVYIDGKILAEPYVKFPCSWEHEPRTLGPFEYYFVGDNRSMPQVDHTEGKAPRERIMGKVLL